MTTPLSAEQVRAEIEKLPVGWDEDDDEVIERAAVLALLSRLSVSAPERARAVSLLAGEIEPELRVWYLAEVFALRDGYGVDQEPSEDHLEIARFAWRYVEAGMAGTRQQDVIEALRARATPPSGTERET